MSETHVFRPSPRKAIVENMFGALAVAIVVPLCLFYIKEEKNTAVLATFSIGGALTTYLYYAHRNRTRGLQSLEVGPDEVIVGSGAGRAALPWTSIERIESGLKWGEHWRFIARPPASDAFFRVDGFSFSEAEAIEKAIRECAGARDVAVHKQWRAVRGV